MEEKRGPGRPKGKKRQNKQRLIKYKPKNWVKSMHGTYDQEHIDWLLQNNLPLDEYIDTLNNKYKKNK